MTDVSLHKCAKKQLQNQSPVKHVSATYHKWINGSVSLCLSLAGATLINVLWEKRKSVNKTFMQTHAES